MSPPDSAHINSRSVIVALAVLLCAPSLHLMVLFVIYAGQILKRNLYFIVSSTTIAGKKNVVLTRVSISDTASFAPAGFIRTSHFRHY